MSEKEKQLQEEQEDECIVVDFLDEEGNTESYLQEEVLLVGGDRYALLVRISDEEEDGAHGHGCDCGCEDEAFFAKIVANADGEDEYVEPTDEEFEMVQSAYDALFDEEENGEE